MTPKETRTVQSSSQSREFSIFLSASVPSPQRAEVFRRVPDSQREIEQAVVALARAVFGRGGRLVFGGHPSISPLVALVAGEYAYPRAGILAPEEQERPASRHEPSVLIHQLSAYQGKLPDPTLWMESVGLARIVWHEVIAGDSPGTAETPPYPLSMRAMRHQMLADDSPLAKTIKAMVCIGGMEGIFEEATIFAAAGNRPIYAIAATGGAAEMLTQSKEFGAATRRVPEVIAIDDKLKETRLRLRDKDGEFFDAPSRFVPYPAIMDELVNRVVG